MHGTFDDFFSNSFSHSWMRFLEKEQWKMLIIKELLGWVKSSLNFCLAGDKWWHWSHVSPLVPWIRNCAWMIPEDLCWRLHSCCSPCYDTNFIDCPHQNIAGFLLHILNAVISEFWNLFSLSCHQIFNNYLPKVKWTLVNIHNVL